MAPTDERMVPEHADAPTVLEHLYRYRFAAQYVGGKRVLDIACGEGYGAAGLLAAGASSVFGVDIASEACQHARAKYGVTAVVGSATAIPVADAQFDAVVSFETIEHVAEPAEFVREARRVLKPGGTFVVSTPNKLIFRQVALDNPYHFSEMTSGELTALLTKEFSPRLLVRAAPADGPVVESARVRGRAQHLGEVPWIQPVEAFGAAGGRLQRRTTDDASSTNGS